MEYDFQSISMSICSGDKNTIRRIFIKKNSLLFMYFIDSDQTMFS